MIERRAPAAKEVVKRLYDATFHEYRQGHTRRGGDALAAWRGQALRQAQEPTLPPNSCC